MRELPCGWYSAFRLKPVTYAALFTKEWPVIFLIHPSLFNPPAFLCFCFAFACLRLAVFWPGSKLAISPGADSCLWLEVLPISHFVGHFPTTLVPRRPAARRSRHTAHADRSNSVITLLSSTSAVLFYATTKKQTNKQTNKNNH